MGGAASAALWIPANTKHSVAISGSVSMRTLYLLPKLCGFAPMKCLVMDVSAAAVRIDSARLQIRQAP